MTITERAERAVKLSGGGFIIGYSALGSPIYAAHLGKSRGKQIIITAGIHARECYSALVVIEQMRRFSGDGGAYFVPLVNPDGAAFFESGICYGSEFLKAHESERLIWKANAFGVDLNCNFDAKWGTGKSNKLIAGASDYIGEYPMSAPETRALADFTLDVKPSMTVSYHAMGGELYWEFFQRGRKRARDLSLASRIAERIDVTRVDGDLSSAGGYKDFCVTLGIPAVTIELVKRGTHPLKESAYRRDIELNAELPRFILDIL